MAQFKPERFQQVLAVDRAAAVMLNEWYLNSFRIVTTFARYIMKYFHKAVTLV
jgi:hypothetical protein